MSLPSELRVLCHQLSLPTAQLPQITPKLLRNVSRCQVPLSSPAGGKGDTSESAVLVHKLKTQVSTLLHGKSVEGRFTAVVLIKAIVDVGGWEILRGVESWVRGLLAILGKQDPVVTKRLCILALTSIYLKTHQYQSLVREITTPTLPPFVSSCLNLISAKSAQKAPDAPSSLTEAVFEAFSVLVPRYPTIFRPSAGQIKTVIRPYVAPTPCDARFVPLSLRNSARGLAVLLNQTAAKNTSGEEWGKSVRELVKEIHGTADQVFRAVVEDWESVAGHISHPADINVELGGGGKSSDDWPTWNGIDAGLERLTGLLQLLEEYFQHQTATSVTVPLGLIVDLLTRLMSLVPPTSTKGSSEYGSLRLHPGIERDEREGLFAGLPHIHAATMNFYSVLIDRLQKGFTSLAQSCVDQVAWAFQSGRHDENYRMLSYQLLSKTLPLCGTSLSKTTVDRLSPVLIRCCKEFRLHESYSSGPASSTEVNGKSSTNAASANADTFLQSKTAYTEIPKLRKSSVLASASELLPLFLSSVPQQHLEGYIRAELDRTAILAHNKDAMLASVLNPYLGRNGSSLPSILPHLCRAFPHDATVEALTRPRMPMLRQSQALLNELQLELEEENESDDVMLDVIPEEEEKEIPQTMTQPLFTNNTFKGEEKVSKVNHWGVPSGSKAQTTISNSKPVAGVENKVQLPERSTLAPAPPPKVEAVAPGKVDDDDSDSDVSVHLDMDLSDSEDEEAE